MKLTIGSSWTAVVLNDFAAQLTLVSGSRVQYAVSQDKPNSTTKPNTLRPDTGIIPVGIQTLWVRSSVRSIIQVEEVSTAQMGDLFTYHSEEIQTRNGQSEYYLIDTASRRIINNAKIAHLGDPVMIRVYLAELVTLNGNQIVMPPPIGTEFVVEVFTEDVGQQIGFVGVYDHSRDLIQFYLANEQPLRSLFTFKVMKDDDSVWGGGIALTGIAKIA